MIKVRSLIFLLLFSSFLISCSVNKLAVSASSGLLYESSDGILEESNYEVFKEGIAGNLILIEGLSKQSPENLNLLATLTKGYAGYAFAVNETKMIEEEWSQSKTETGRAQALLNYTRSLNFGINYLKQKGIVFAEIFGLMNETGAIKKLLSTKLSHDNRDLETVLFSAQSLGALINLQKDNMGLISQLTAVKEMFDWVCEIKPNINFGTCDIFYGAYEAGRPAMLGGNPKKGKEIFLNAIIKHPHNWLLRSSFIQYYLIPLNDEEGFNEQMNVLKILNEEFNQYYIYNQHPKLESSWVHEVKLRFYQTLSLKRYEVINKYRKQFF